MDSLDIHKSLQQEIKSQKNSIVRDVKSRRSGKGGAGRVLFPSDYLSKEEKKVYRQAGEVKVYSMFDTIMKIEEFKKLPPEQQVRHMVEYRKRFKGTEIAKGMGIKDATYYALTSSLGVAKKYNNSNSTGSKKSKGAKDSSKAVEVVDTAPTPQYQAEIVYKPDGIMLGYGGTKTSEDIIKRLSKIELLLDGEESMFEVEIKIKEVVS